MTGLNIYLHKEKASEKNPTVSWGVLTPLILVHLHPVEGICTQDSSELLEPLL